MSETKTPAPDPMADMAALVNLDLKQRKKAWLDRFTALDWSKDEAEASARQACKDAVGLKLSRTTVMKRAKGQSASLYGVIFAAIKSHYDSDLDAARTLLEIAEEAGLPEGVALDVEDMPDMYHERKAGVFWYRSSDRYERIMKETALDKLSLAGLSVQRENDGKPSEAHRKLLEIIDTKGVDYVGPLAGYGIGPQTFGDCHILVSRPLKLIQPVPGDWQVVWDIMNGMFGKVQMEYVLATLKYGYEAYRDGSDRPIPMTTMCGPGSGDDKKQCAWKSTFAKRVIVPVWGGRVVDASRFLLDRTEFNSDLCGCEVLLLDDVKPYANWLSRHDLSEHVKNIIVGSIQSLHAKGKDAIPLRPRWRVVMTLNDDDESMRQMPDFSRSFKEKAHLFKISEFELPMPNRTDEEWKALDAAVKAALPGMIYDLLHWNVPQEYRSDRYGIKHYHHPDLLEQLYEMSNEYRLAELIDIGLRRRGNNGHWTGSAAELKAELCSNPSIGKDAGKLLDWTNAAGTLLGHLQKRDPKKYQRDRVGEHRKVIWTVKLDAATPLAHPSDTP